MRTAILDALEARYEAQILESDATLKIYLDNSVGMESILNTWKK